MNVMLFEDSVQQLAGDDVRLPAIVMNAPIGSHIIIRVQNLHVPIFAFLHHLDAQYCGGTGCGAGNIRMFA